jgi:hypothetical protein
MTNPAFNRARLTVLAGAILVVLATATGIARAQDYLNIITFVNQSGEDALVKLVGPVRLNIPVPNASSNSVHAPAGNYYILTRYCGRQGNCWYSKGDPFSVTQTATQYSEIEITLHKVAGGTYHTRDASASEFNSQ